MKYVRISEVPRLEDAERHGNKILCILYFHIKNKSVAGEFKFFYASGDKAIR